MIRKLVCTAVLALSIVPAYAGQVCNWQLEGGQISLATGPYATKTYWGDTNNAYAYFTIANPGSYIYRFKGNFPLARYMSLESSVVIDSLLGLGVFEQESLVDVDDLADHEIELDDEGGVHPFRDGNPLASADRSFTVFAVPEGVPVPEGIDYDPRNVLDIPNGFSTFIAYRANSLYKKSIDNPGIPPFGPDITSLNKAALHKIEAFDALTGIQVDCPSTLKGDVNYGEVPPPDLIDLLQFGRVALEQSYTKFEKRLAFPFMPTTVPVEGSAGIPSYLIGVTVQRPGNVAIIRFAKPSYLDTYSGARSNFTSSTDVRFWSLCALDASTSIVLACLPDWMSPGNPGAFVTLVYGPNDPQLKDKAKRLGWVSRPV